MIGASLTVFRKVRHRGAAIAPGDYVVGKKTVGRTLSESDAEAVLTYPTWARLLDEKAESVSADIESDLSSDDETLKAMLGPMTAEQRNEVWASLDEEAMAMFLVERAGKERKSGWKVQTMGNMIEKHLGL